MVGGSVHWLSNFAVGLLFPFIQVSVTLGGPWIRNILKQERENLFNNMNLAPLPAGGPRSLQLHHLCCDMSPHHHLHIPGCPRDQGQDVHGDQSEFRQDEQGVRGAPREGGTEGTAAPHSGALAQGEEPVERVCVELPSWGIVPMTITIQN